MLMAEAEAEGGRRAQNTGFLVQIGALGGLALVLALGDPSPAGQRAGRRGRRGSLTAARRVLSAPV
jgi:hypothetical protein